MKKFFCILISLLCFGLSFAQNDNIAAGDYIVGDYKIHISYAAEISIKSYSGSEENIIIPDNIEGYPVKYISEKAFSDCSIVSVVIPDSVIEIGDAAFYKCSKLKSVKIGNSVVKICAYAFEKCKSLTSIEIPDSVVQIQDYAFSYCNSLKSAVLGNSLVNLGYSAFYKCDKLENVVFGNSLKTINAEVFSKCSSLKSVEIPDSVNSIGNQAFAFCSNLESVVIGKNITQVNFNTMFTSSPVKKITLHSAEIELLNVPEGAEVIKPKAKSLKEQMAERNSN